MGNFRRVIEGKLVSYLHLRSCSVLRATCCYVASLMFKVCKLLGTHKERALALLFFVVEAISVVLDLIGKNKEVFLLAAFLLSAFGFAITLYSCMDEKTNTKTLAERQLKVVEIVFSISQLIVTFTQFLLTVLQVKNSYNASAFPLAFAMIAVVFIFKKSEKNVDDHSAPRDFNLPLVNIQYIDHSVSISTPIEPDQNEVSWPNPSTPLFNHCDVLCKNIEVLVPEYGVQRAIDLIVFTNYKDLYRELKTMFEIRLYFNKWPKSHWELIYEDEKGDMFVVGDNSWDEFYRNVRKLYLYKKKSLRNNFIVNPPEIIHEDVSAPPASLPAEQQAKMDPVTTLDPHSSHLNDKDIEMEAPSTLNLEMTAPPPPPPVSLDQLEADAEGDCHKPQLIQAAM